jgi:hypothetical protein
MLQWMNTQDGCVSWMYSFFSQCWHRAQHVLEEEYMTVISYLGIDLTHYTLTISSEHGEKRVLQTQDGKDHQASAAHALEVTP